MKARPKPSQGLDAAGRALWRAVVADLPETLEYDPRELALLAAAARQADAIAALEDAVARDGLTVEGSHGQPRLHPAVAEARLGRAVLARLLGELRVDVQDAVAVTASSKRARRAADSRWAEHRVRKALPSA